MASNPCCCCCIFAKTGALLVGCLNIVASLRKVLQLTSDLHTINVLIDSKNKTQVLNGTVEDENSFVSSSNPETISKPYEAILFVELILNVLNIIFGALLIHGVRRELPFLVKANLTFSILFFSLSVSLRIFGVFLGVKISFTKDSSEFITNAARVYFMYVVYCAYMEIKVSTLQGMAGRARDSGGSKF